MPPQITLSKIAAVMAGAALGGAARYLVAALFAERVMSRFPWGTLTINVTGCFLIGLVWSVLDRMNQPPGVVQLFLVTGILGGYTTYSAFGWENFQLIRQGHPFIAMTYAIASVVCGLAGVWLGAFAARR